MKRSFLALALAAGLPLSSAHAELSFNGFANIVAGKASNDGQVLGYDKDVDFKQDSLFALQASTDLGENLSATVQIVSRGKNDWDTEFEWAYLAYNVSDNTRILAGRQRAPFYMYSDYTDVSYAYPWIVAPQGVYDLELTNYDGISVIHNFSLGEFDNTLQVIAGQESNDIRIVGLDIKGDFDNLVGASLTVNRDWLTLRAAYMQADITMNDPRSFALAAAWQTVPGYEYIGNHIASDEEQSTFAEVGLQIDHNNWLFIAEHTYMEHTDGPARDEESLYVMGGYRFDNVLVHLTYGRDKNEANRVVNELPNIPALESLVTSTRTGFNFRVQDLTYYSLGARWDFHDSAALKIEYTRAENDLIDRDTNVVRTALVTVF